MKKALRYLRICLKKIAKTYPAIIGVILIMFICIFAVAGLILNKYSKLESKQKINVGVVNNSSESYVDMGLFALDKIDNVRFSVSFKEMSESAARHKLESSDIVGYVMIPDGYLHNIFSGKNQPAVYVTKRNSSGFNSAVTNKLTKTVSDVVTRSQALIYAVFDIDHDLGRSQIYKDNEKINALYMQSVMDRENIYEEKILGIADSVSMPGYYICGMLTFFIFLLGISFCKVLNKNDYTVYRVLKRNRIASTTQILAEYISFWLFMFITVALFTFAEFKALETKGNGVIPELSYFDTASICRFSISLIPVVMAISAFHMFLYEFANGIISSVILQFVITTLFAYLSGFFYPSSFFPEFATRIGNILPSGVAFAYIRKHITFSGAPLENAALIGYTLVFLALATVIREKRIRRSGI